MANRELQRDDAAHAVADDVRLFDLQEIEQRGDVVGEVRVAEVALDVGRATVALHLDCYHLARLRELTDPRLAQLFVMVMNDPWSRTTGSPLPWTS